MTLRGVTVLSTRPHEQSSDLIRAIEERGGRPVVVPMIRVVAPSSWDECDHAIDSPDGYQGAVFTSPNAVLWFFRRLEERGSTMPALNRGEVYAVGPSTRLALDHRGITVAGVPSEASGAALARMLRSSPVAGKRFLAPRGNLARDEVVRGLESAGAIVDSPVVYRTLPPDPHDAETLARLTADGAYHVVIFASPSAVRHFAVIVPPSALGALAPRPKIVAAGRTTADTIRELDFPLDAAAPEAGTAALVRVVEQVVKGS